MVFGGAGLGSSQTREPGNRNAAVQYLYLASLANFLQVLRKVRLQLGNRYVSHLTMVVTSR